MGTIDPPATPDTWLAYLRYHLQARYGSLRARGWKARFAAAAEIDAGSATRYVNGEKIPDIATCRRIARALNRPVLEVVVAAGYLAPSEARMRDLPQVPPSPPLSPEMERLRRLLDDPRTDADTRHRIESMLAMVVDLVDRPARSS